MYVKTDSFPDHYENTLMQHTCMMCRFLSVLRGHTTVSIGRQPIGSRTCRYTGNADTASIYCLDKHSFEIIGCNHF